MKRFRKPQPLSSRRGATMVEMAFAIPIFLVVTFGIIEFGHAFMVQNVIAASAKRGARQGISSSSVNQDIITEVETVLASVMDPSQATIQIKDASVIDESTYDPATVDYDSLPDVSINQLGTREAFLVRITVPFSEVAITGQGWIKADLTSQSILRKE